MADIILASDDSISSQEPIDTTKASPLPPQEQQAPEEGSEKEAPSSTLTGGKKKKKKKKNKDKKKKLLEDVFIYKDRDAFKVLQDAVSGRCVVAARDLGPGELVLDEPPFAKVCSSQDVKGCQGKKKRP